MFSSAAPKHAMAKDTKTVDEFQKWRQSQAMPIAHIKGFDSGISGGDLWAKYAKQRLIQFNVIAFEASAFNDSGFTAVVAGFLNHRKSNFAFAFTPTSKVDAFWHGWNDPAMKEKFAGRLMVVGFDMDAEKRRFELDTEESRCSALSADEKEAYLTGRVAMKTANSKTCISLGGDAACALEAELSTQKEGCAWAIYALSRGKTEAKPTLLDWAHENKNAVNVEFVRDVDENEDKGFCKPPMKAKSSSVSGAVDNSDAAMPAWLPAACVVGLGVVIGIALLRRQT